jgi:hypothetical protein
MIDKCYFGSWLNKIQASVTYVPWYIVFLRQRKREENWFRELIAHFQHSRVPGLSSYMRTCSMNEYNQLKTVLLQLSSRAVLT